jgi:hypothetical protein
VADLEIDNVFFLTARGPRVLEERERVLTTRLILNKYSKIFSGKANGTMS